MVSLSGKFIHLSGDFISLPWCVHTNQSFDSTMVAIILWHHITKTEVLFGEHTKPGESSNRKIFYCVNATFFKIQIAAF
jgi:hypothetical protein